MTAHTDLLDTLEAPHLHGHSCVSHFPGVDAWYNPGAGRTGPCPTLTTLRDLRTHLAALTTQVHDAAHDDAAAVAVAEGMTGLVMADLEPEEAREGWVLTARLAIEALAAHLDPTVHQ
jgi:hypothetical protein